jgi:FkbM family methyltransferase
MALSSYVPLAIRATAHGEMIFLPQDTFVGRSLACYGQYSEREAEAFRRLLRPGMTALDIGANIGYFTVTMAKLLGAQGRVHAFEPQRLLHRLLCANLAVNACHNATCYLAAVGRESGAALMPRPNYQENANFGGVELAGAGAEIETQVVAIDDLDLPACDFIKVDVEGMEKQALEGAVRTIARCQPLLWVENDRVASARGLVEFIESLGYEAYWQVTPLFEPDNFAHNPENVFGRQSSFNLLAKPAARDLAIHAPRCTPENPTLPGMAV